MTVPHRTPDQLDDAEARAVQERSDASQATRVLNEPAFTDAVAKVKDALWKDFAGSDLDDDATRRNARIGLDLLDKLLKNLRHVMETGKLADAELTKVEDERKKTGIFRKRRVA